MKYHYKAIVKSVYDGDTMKVDIDLGFGVWLHNQTIRLFGINAPELKKPTRSLGLSSRDRLKELVLNKEIILETLKDKKEKFGRWLGIVFIENKNINQIMVEEKFAEKI